MQTKVYAKPTNTGLLLHYNSHVDDRYKRGLLLTTSASYQLLKMIVFALLRHLKASADIVRAELFTLFSMKTKEKAKT